MIPDDLIMEFRLTIAVRHGCECAPYFLQRGPVLLPEVVAEAHKRDIDPVDLFADYARGVHRRHEAGLSLSTGAAS